MRLLVSFLALALGVSGHTSAGEPDAPRTCTAECKMITLPAKGAVALLPELNDETKTTGALEKLDGMIARGEATLAGLLSAKGVEGQHIRAASLKDVRFATEFQAPDGPPVFPVPSLEIVKNWPQPKIVPNAFEKVGVGESLEVALQPTADPKVVVCDYVLQHVRLERFAKIEAGRLAGGEQLAIEQPVFSTMKDESTVTMVSGQPKVVGVHRLPGAEGGL